MVVQLDRNLGNLEEGWSNGENVWQKMSVFNVKEIVLVAGNHLICEPNFSFSPCFHFRYEENHNHCIIHFNSHLLRNCCFLHLVFW